MNSNVSRDAYDPFDVGLSAFQVFAVTVGVVIFLANGIWPMAVLLAFAYIPFGRGLRDALRQRRASIADPVAHPRLGANGLATWPARIAALAVVVSAAATLLLGLPGWAFSVFWLAVLGVWLSVRFLRGEDTSLFS